MILADALDLIDPVSGGIALSSYPEDRTLVQLREAFCEDVLSQMCDEFRLRRGALVDGDPLTATRTIRHIWCAGVEHTPPG